MSLADEFILRYQREFDFFEQLARLAAQRLELAIQSNGIRAIVTYRAKRQDRLYEKIRSKIETNGITSIDELYQEIVDLSGVRVALYFPAQREQLNQVIYDNFDVVLRKVFPDSSKRPSYSKRFTGYWATHYRVRLSNNNSDVHYERFSKNIVEIQVASVLMHAWSEVEHDLVYKPLQGSLSAEEYAILDELNGLVMAGEIALERLEQAINRRVQSPGKQFQNHFELASFLFEFFISRFEAIPTKLILGRTDVLFYMLDNLGLSNVNDITPLLQAVAVQESEDKQHNEATSVSDQIIDLLISTNPENATIYLQAREIANIFADDSDEKLGLFIRLWAELENKLRDAIGKEPSVMYMSWSNMVSELGKILPSGDLAMIISLRELRNAVIHNYSASYFDSFGDAIENLRRIIERVDSFIKGGDI